MWNSNLFMTRTQMRAYDRIAMEEFGIPGPILMENAGLGAALVIRSRFDARERIAVIAGPGNNGGDGFVIARHLLNAGFDVETFLAHPREKIGGDALLNLTILDKMGGRIIDIATPTAFSGHTDFGGRKVLVDALLGTGVSRPVEGHLGQVIDAVNAGEATRIAIDIPSGLDADTGAPAGRSVRADITITFGHLKRGLLLHPGAALAGELQVVSIGAPAAVSEAAGFDGEVISKARVASRVPRRARDSHKGTFGHLLVVGGVLGKTGAAAMSGQAAMRVGTGLVTLATTAKAQPVLEVKCLETMVDALIEDTHTRFSEQTAARLATLLEGKKAVAVGPGLGTSETMAAVCDHLIETADVPLVIDADGINLVAARPESLISRTSPTVLTPHPGEMARLMRTSVHAVQSDRIGAARETAKRFGAVVVLKGAHSIVAAPDGRVYLNPTGNPGMATGGMGDVLTGIIGGFLAEGLPPVDATLLGVYLHGEAGDTAVRRAGESGVLASDVIQDIPTVMADWAENTEPLSTCETETE